jgi:hypothetical protein
MLMAVASTVMPSLPAFKILTRLRSAVKVFSENQDPCQRYHRPAKQPFDEELYNVHWFNILRRKFVGYHPCPWVFPNWRVDEISLDEVERITV